jgi:hypothetical protein
MKRIENDCVDCPREIGCFGDTCPLMNVPHYYCDECGYEATLYHYNDRELCEYCVLKELEKVEGSWN